MKITANQVTLLRIGMGFGAVALFGRHLWANYAALGLIAAAIGLDGLDGYLARRQKLATPAGAQLDILGDRVIENLFFTFFAVCGLTSLWVPVVFFVRGTLTDFIRSLAARSSRPGREKTPFGKNSMLESRWAQALVGSRFSRGAYAAMKCACFCALGFEWTLMNAPHGEWPFGVTPFPELLLAGARLLVGATVAFCLARAVPVVWEGRRYLAALAQTQIAARRPRPQDSFVVIPSAVVPSAVEGARNLSERSFVALKAGLGMTKKFASR